MALVKTFSVVSNPEHPGAKRLARSAKYWGWDHSFIVKGDQPEVGYSVWRPTYRAEQLGQLDFIRAAEAPDVMYLDGYDTVFTGPPQELGLPPGQLSFGGDTVLFPQLRHLAELFPAVGLEMFRYINAGCIWGDSRIMSELAADYLTHSPELLVNQTYYNQRYIYEKGVGRSRLVIDTKGEVALNTMLMQKRFFEMKSNRVHFLPSDTYPLVLHSPGTGQTFGEGAVPLPPELERLYA